MTVHCGHAYHLFLPIASKDKLVVPAYIASDDKVRFFVINTNRTNFQITNSRITNHVLNLSANDNRGFLTNDSWLTCNEVVGGYTSAEIDVINNCYRGQLDNGTISTVRQVIQNSRLYAETEKNLILGQWPTP